MTESNNDVKDNNADSQSSEESESTENQDNESKTVPYERFREVNEQKKELEKQLKGSEEDSSQTTNRSSDVDGDEVVTKTDLERTRLKDKGYEKETVDFIMRNGGESALDDDPHVQAAVESMSEQSQAEKAANVDASSKSEISANYSPDELKDMSSEEMKKALSE